MGSNNSREQIKKCVDVMSVDDIIKLKSKLIENTLSITKQITNTKIDDTGIILRNASLVNLFRAKIDNIIVSTNDDAFFGTWTFMIDYFGDDVVIDTIFMNSFGVFIECIYDMSGNILYGPFNSPNKKPTFISFLEALAITKYRF